MQAWCLLWQTVSVNHPNLEIHVEAWLPHSTSYQTFRLVAVDFSHLEILLKDTVRCWNCGIFFYLHYIINAYRLAITIITQSKKRETRVIHFDFLVSFSIVCLLWFVDSVNWNPSPSVSFQFKFSIQFSLNFEIIVSDYNWFDFSFLFHVINFVFSIYIWINRNPIFYESQVCCTFPFPSWTMARHMLLTTCSFWNWICGLFYSPRHTYNLASMFFQEQIPA